jgi:hypothetical protein
MRRGFTPGAFLLVLLLCLQAAAQEAVPRIVDVRVGRHPSFDRVVLELEREVPVLRLPTAPGEGALLEVRARPLLPRQEIATGSSLLEMLILEEILEGTRIRLRNGGGKVRVFLLASPPRLVLDVADAGTDPFEPPPGTERVPSLAPDVVEAPIESPAPVAVAPQETEPGEPPPEEPMAGEVVPGKEVPTESAPDEPVTPEVELEELALAEVQPEEPAPEPTPEVELQPAPPDPHALPLPPREAVSEEPGPTEAGRAAGASRDRWLALLVWVGGPLLLVGLGLYLARGRRRAPPESAEPRIPESITPEEVLSASDRLDLLEKRIDEEVRSRMHLENRVVQVQEDLKVVRDRVSRISRRGEGAS